MNSSNVNRLVNIVLGALLLTVCVCWSYGFGEARGRLSVESKTFIAGELHGYMSAQEELAGIVVEHLHEIQSSVLAREQQESWRSDGSEQDRAMLLKWFLERASGPLKPEIPTDLRQVADRFHSSSPHSSAVEAMNKRTRSFFKQQVVAIMAAEDLSCNLGLKSGLESFLRENAPK